MTRGTSTHPRGIPSIFWAAAERDLDASGECLAAWFAKLRSRVPSGPQLGRLAGVLYLGALALLLTTAWQGPPEAAGGLVAMLPAWHLSFLMATGAGVALLSFGRPSTQMHAPHVSDSPRVGMNELMAQMNHELRTPLNAVIGFSELMLRELHGPLGNARYQEYAHHIAQSGEWLLRSSEEALAVTEAMTGLMTDQGRTKRERRLAVTLVEEAWSGAMRGRVAAAAELVVSGAAGCDIACEGRATIQALEHLFREALRLGASGAAVTVACRCRGDDRSLEIRVARASCAGDAAASGGDNLRTMLARLLLQMQGAAVACSLEGNAWVARVDFSARS